MMNAKRLIKHGLQLAIARMGRQHWRLPRSSLVVLTYHRVLADHDPAFATMQPGMVVSESVFRMQMELLGRLFRPVPLSEWIERLKAHKPLPPRACAVTFDDGWHDNYETAFPILKRHQIPATIFLVSDFVGTHRRFWPERLFSLLSDNTSINSDRAHHAYAWLKEFGADPALIRRAPSTEAIDRVITAMKSLPDQAINERLDAMELLLNASPGPRAPDLVDWHAVTEMIDSGLVEIGSHTRTHCRLGHVAEEHAQREIVGSKKVIEERLGRPITLFCYPNGEISPLADRMVRQHYRAACSTRRGWNGPSVDPHRLRRISIHDGSAGTPDAFLSRLSGWM